MAAAAAAIAVWGTRTCRRRCVALGSLFVCGNYDSLLRAWRALLLASGHTCYGDLPDQRAAAHMSMACRWRSVATCHRARFCSVVDSKRRILATRPCAETEHCDFAMRVLMAQEIEQLAYEH